MKAAFPGIIVPDSERLPRAVRSPYVAGKPAAGSGGRPANLGGNCFRHGRPAGPARLPPGWPHLPLCRQPSRYAGVLLPLWHCHRVAQPPVRHSHPFPLWQSFCMLPSSVTTLVTQERIKGEVGLSLHPAGRPLSFICSGEPYSLRACIPNATPGATPPIPQNGMMPPLNRRRNTPGFAARHRTSPKMNIPRLRLQGFLAWVHDLWSLLSAPSQFSVLGLADSLAGFGVPECLLV